MNIRRIEILGIPVDCVTRREALDFVDALIAGNRRGAILAVNPEKVIKAQQDPQLLGVLRSAALLIPDGIGVVTAARILGQGRIEERVPGADLMLAICERSVTPGYRIFLYGATAEVNRKAQSALRASYPGINIVGASDGYVAEERMPALIEAINASRADILFVALGSPRQEMWIARWLPSLGVKVCQGVGGTFDIIAGAVRRAPLAWQAANLEWAYRLMRQPRRVLRQMALPRFAWQVLARRLERRGPVR